LYRHYPKSVGLEAIWIQNEIEMRKLGFATIWVFREALCVLCLRNDEKLPSSLRVTVLQKVTGQRGDVENFVFLLLISERKEKHTTQSIEAGRQELAAMLQP